MMKTPAEMTDSELLDSLAAIFKRRGWKAGDVAELGEKAGLLAEAQARGIGPGEEEVSDEQERDG